MLTLVEPLLRALEAWTRVVDRAAARLAALLARAAAPVVRAGGALRGRLPVRPGSLEP